VLIGDSSPTAWVQACKIAISLTVPPRHGKCCSGYLKGYPLRKTAGSGEGRLLIAQQFGLGGGEDFVGQHRIVDGAREHHGADKLRHGGERLAPAHRL